VTVHIQIRQVTIEYELAEVKNNIPVHFKFYLSIESPTKSKQGSSICQLKR